MAYGTPASPEDIEPYYTHIRRGRPPTEEQLAELTARYAAIGGISPLAQRTRAQLDAIAAALDAAEPGRFVVRLGQKHAAPFIEDAVAELAGRRASSGSSAWCWHRTTRGSASASTTSGPAQAAAEAGLGVRRRRLAGAWSRRSSTTRRRRCASGSPPCPSAPRWCSPRTRCPSGCSTATPTPTSCAPRPRRSPTRAGLGRWATWSIGWQSAGRTPEPWRGPDILEIIRELAATGRADGVAGGAAGLHLGPPRGGLRPGHRGGRGGGRGGPGLRPHRRGQRRSRGHGGAGRPAARLVA